MNQVVALLMLSAVVMGEDMEFGPGSDVQKDATGKFVIITDGRGKHEYIVNLDRIV